MLENLEPKRDKNLNILFRKFAAYKLEIKEMAARTKAKKTAPERKLALKELEQDAQKLQEIKNEYSFSSSERAKFLAAAFAGSLEELEAKLSRYKSGPQGLSAQVGR